MIIYLVNQYAVPPRQAGPSRHHNFAKTLARRGHKVIIIASSFDHMTRTETLEKNKKLSQEVIDDVEYLWIKSPAYKSNSLARIYNWLYFAAQLTKTTRMLPKPNIVVGSSPSLFSAWAASRLALERNALFILEVRDLWPQSLVDLGRISSRHPVVRLLEILEKSLYQRAEKIISVLPKGKQHMVEEKKAKPEKIIHIPNGVDLSSIPSFKLPQRKKPLTLMYTGAHSTANVLDTLIKTAWTLKKEGWEQRVQFIAIGDGPEKPKLQAQAKKQDLNNFLFFPPVPKEKIYQEMAKADVFVWPMRDIKLYQFGVSPNKLFDYMAMGKPVLCDAPEYANPIHEAKAGITVPCQDVSAWAQAVKDLAEMPIDQFQQMGISGRRFVEKNYDLETLVNRFESSVTSPQILLKQ